MAEDNRMEEILEGQGGLLRDLSQVAKRPHVSLAHEPQKWGRQRRLPDQARRTAPPAELGRPEPGREALSPTAYRIPVTDVAGRELLHRRNERVGKTELRWVELATEDFHGDRR
jgi:hypothetical protein